MMQLTGPVRTILKNAMISSRTVVLVLFSVLTLRSEPWTLSQALHFARTNSPDARIAQHRIAAAQAVLGQANAAFWPKLQASSSYTRTDHPASVFGFALNQRSYSIHGPSSTRYSMR